MLDELFFELINVILTIKWEISEFSHDIILREFFFVKEQDIEAVLPI